jgi:tRNA(Leu) C34 or U34 (ribose-2'-O)-methylase TrmL
MDQKVVSSLELGIEKAISEVIMRMGLERLPQLPSQRTMHLMAKAAVSVYEAVAEAHDERD